MFQLANLTNSASISDWIEAGGQMHLTAYIDPFVSPLIIGARPLSEQGSDIIVRSSIPMATKSWTEVANDILLEKAELWERLAQL